MPRRNWGWDFVRALIKHFNKLVQPKHLSVLSNQSSCMPWLNAHICTSAVHKYVNIHIYVYPILIVVDI